MFIDTGLNSVSTVLTNLHQSFHEAAVRCLEYVRVLAKVRTTCSSLLISAFAPKPDDSPNVPATLRNPEMVAFPASQEKAAHLYAQIKREHESSAVQRRSCGYSYRSRWTDEWHRDRGQHRRIGFRDGAATCAFAQRQESCACAEHHLAAAAAVVSVAEASVSQLAGTELAVALSPIAHPRGPADEPQGARDSLAGKFVLRRL